METLVLHPEELFDKANKGLATADELARLEAHVAQCTTCRFERQVRLDFDAVGGSPADLDDLVARALSGAKAAPEAPRRRRVGPLLIAATVALMGFGSFAAVAQFTGVLPRFIEALSDRTRAPVIPSGVEGRNKPLVPSEVEGPVIEEQPQVLPPSPPPVVMVVPRVVAPPVRKAVDVEKVAPPPEPLPLPAPPVETPSELFARATQARVRGDAIDAIARYRELVARFPSSAEATLSQAQLGRLLLDRGDATAALQAFDAYLGTNDQALREEVQGARAMALDVLGRFDEERAAWEAVLHDYPSGVYAPRARTRLESLTP